ncbi:MAG: hypothetical protein QOE85_280 [Actinomycetota bacterium]|jgi:hypothetical protein|nr:hypothetical protein [Glaciihabitans sp.]MDQ1560939.1 hypothetical protein [Actinomycetota bacterium]
MWDMIFNILSIALSSILSPTYRDPTEERKRNRERWANVSANGVRSFRATDPRGKGKGKGKRKRRGR